MFSGSRLLKMIIDRTHCSKTSLIVRDFDCYNHTDIYHACENVSSVSMHKIHFCCALWSSGLLPGHCYAVAKAFC